PWIIQCSPGPIWSSSKAAWPRSKLRFARTWFDRDSRPDVCRAYAREITATATSAAATAAAAPASGGGLPRPPPARFHRRPPAARGGRPPAGNARRAAARPPRRAVPPCRLLLHRPEADGLQVTRDAVVEAPRCAGLVMQDVMQDHPRRAAEG